MSIIKTRKENKWVQLELNWPEKRNILSLEMIQTLMEALDRFSQDPQVHLMVLSGAGGHFCAGGDLRWMRLSEHSSDLENLNQVKLLAQLFNRAVNFSSSCDRTY